LRLEAIEQARDRVGARVSRDYNRQLQNQFLRNRISKVLQKLPKPPVHGITGKGF
jgi:hypothetical protein